MKPPQELLGTVLDLAEARRRRNRWRVLAAAAAVVVIAGGVFGGLRAATSATNTVTASRYSPGGAGQTVQTTSKITGASATIRYSQELWGNAFEVLVDHIPPGTTYSDSEGHRRPTHRYAGGQKGRPARSLGRPQRRRDGLGAAYAKGLRTVKTCVGTDWCRFGTEDFTGLGIKIEKFMWGSWTPAKVKMAVLGCPRNCAEATCKDVG